MFLIRIVVVIFCASFFLSVTFAQAKPYQPTQLRSDVTKLWVSDGNTKSDTVLIFSQGGPDDHLTFQKQGKSRLRYIPGYKDMHIAYVHQSQTPNQTILNSTTRISRNQAKYEIQKTIEILDLTVRYFRTRKRNVIVMGNSFGAFIVNQYLAFKNPLADKYFIIAGKIDDDLRTNEQHYRGLGGSYDKSGSKFIPGDTDPTKLNNVEGNRFVAKQYLKWALGFPRYSQLLADKSLEDVVFVYGLKDQNVGKLTPSEVSFLKKKGAKVVPTTGDHYENFYRFVDALMEKKISLL